MRLALLSAAAFVLACGLAAPAPAGAQQTCTASCQCQEAGCGCSSVNGQGSSCTTNGNMCFVYKCSTVIRPTAFAADGRVLWASGFPGDPAPADGARAGRLPGRPLGPADWESIAPGHAVARACDGLIIAHWYDPGAAGAIREASRNLIL